MQIQSVVLALGLLSLQTAQAAEITVAAATSLTDAFKVIAQDFEKKYPQHTVNLTFAASGVLLQQLRYGAPIDVLATADQKTMNEAQQANLIQSAIRANFTANRLVLITTASRPIMLKDLAGLKTSAIKRIAIGNPDTTPAGRYAQAALQQQNLWQGLQDKLIKTQNVRQALDYVARGETEVGFVFSSDVQSQSSKVKVLFNVPTSSAITYPIAVSQDSKVSAEAKQFVQYVQSAAGQKVLGQYGFKAVK